MTFAPMLALACGRTTACAFGGTGGELSCVGGGGIDSLRIVVPFIVASRIGSLAGTGASSVGGAVVSGGTLSVGTLSIGVAGVGGVCSGADCAHAVDTIAVSRMIEIVRFMRCPPYGGTTRP
ncbi:hypothetical protein GCM10027432_09680 [Lysobacter fragariae]